MTGTILLCRQSNSKLRPELPDSELPARMQTVPSRPQARRFFLETSDELHPGDSFVPVAAPLADAAGCQRWLQLAKSTTSTLRRRGSSLQHRLGVIRTWEESHPMPPVSQVPSGLQQGPSGSGAAASAGAASLSPSALREQLLLYTPRLAEDEATKDNDFLAACLLHMASVLASGTQPQHSAGAAATAHCGPVDPHARQLIRQVALAWIVHNGVPAAKARGDSSLQHGHETALLLYNHFPDALPPALWSVLWLCVSLLLQPVQPSTVVEKFGHALYSAKELLHASEELQALEAEAVQKPNRHPRPQAQPLAAAEEQVLAALAAAGCSFHSLSLPLTGLPAGQRRVEIVAASSSSSAAATHPAQVTIWPLLCSAQLQSAGRKKLVNFLLERYECGASVSEQDATAWVPVSTRSIQRLHDGSEHGRSDVHVTWLAPVQGAWLHAPQRLEAAIAGGAHTPLQSDYCPRVRISNLGSSLAEAWTHGISAWLPETGMDA